MKFRLLMVLMLGLAMTDVRAQEVLFESDVFEVTERGVREGQFEAIVESPTRIRSNYVYASSLEPHLLTFKFALNGLDNEMPSGDDHAIYLVPENGRVVTPVIRFGELLEAGPMPKLERPVQGQFDVAFRLDLRHVLEAFERDGYYQSTYGEPVEADEFRGVYVAGSENPLSWDFNAFNESQRLTDPDGDGIYEVTLTFELGGARPFDDEGYAVWSLTEDISDLPQLQSDHLLVDALYNLSLEEMLQDVRDDGAFMAGAKWHGVWTRDVAYAILLGLAAVHPDASKKSLLAKVSDGRIIQDTGTGGSWPVSTDRMTWALAAWELYAVTGDQDWLRTAYDVIATSAEVDLLTARDPETGLFYGESSFLDWREQTYPEWMDPKDIYRSLTLGTNVVHYQTYRILARMATLLGESSSRWSDVATEVRDGINAHLWSAGHDRYGQFLYGRAAYALSERAEALGSALAILFDVANPEQTNLMLEHFPLVPYGVPSVYPQTPEIPPYHNDGVWPFVVGYWMWAAAEGGNASAVEHSLAGIYRAASLFLTNKENLVANTGDFSGTQINSDRQLWSVAATLASVYRVFFGMRFEADHLAFEPFIPESYTGRRTLTGFRYRGATLDITVEGHGSRVISATLDGEPMESVVIPADLTGHHTLHIQLDGSLPPSQATVVPVVYALETPDVEHGDGLHWEPVSGAVAYEIYRNGRRVGVTSALAFALPSSDETAEWQVRSLDAGGRASFLSEPIRLVADDAAIVLRPDDALETEHEGFTGDGYLRLTREEHRDIRFTLDVPEGGEYLVEARYANGSGPVNTDNKAAIRSLYVDGERAGSIVMPQRGDGLWTDWGWSNAVRVSLDAGTHTLSLRFTPADENMNRDVNTALLDYIRLVPAP